MDQSNPDARPGEASTHEQVGVSAEALRLLPEHMRVAARQYVEEGRADDDGFVLAVARNDLRQSFRLADPTNAARMRDWVLFFQAYVPSGAWGSRLAVERWMVIGGLRGLWASAPSDG